MKYVINGMIMAAIAFMVLATVMVTSGRSVRKNELEKALEQAAEIAVSELENQENQGISRTELLEIFNENLAMGIESDAKVNVSVMMADAEKGILSVQAEEAYQNPLGKEEKIQAERTIILENYSVAKKSVFTITFKVGNIDYKVYTLTEGSSLPVPANPEGNFNGWMDETGQCVEIANLTVESDRIFVAKMN